MPKVKKLGRPFKTDWKQVNGMWKTRTDKEIANHLGVSYTSVFLHRKILIADAALEGKSFDRYICKQAKYSRSRVFA